MVVFGYFAALFLLCIVVLISFAFCLWVLGGLVWIGCSCVVWLLIDCGCGV